MTRWIAVAVLLLALVAGCTDAPDSAPAVPVTPRGAVALDPAPAAAAVTALTVPRLDLVDAPLVPLGLNPDRTLQVPPVEQPGTVGYYTGGPRPGEVGPAVILGHVNGGGRPGAFADLDELAAGDRLATRVGNRVTEFEVTRVERVAKDAFPTAAVYSDTRGPELRLITCGGAFDGEQYRDNVIVYARAAG